ncbi:hypothetical protein D881_02510 [Corynebacterium ulcerans NCTC 12077]|nr:hypothetical protein D881_02510 [Corynebacterium ulcerans NCTC 12077]
MLLHGAFLLANAGGKASADQIPKRYKRKEAK